MLKTTSLFLQRPALGPSRPRAPPDSLRFVRRTVGNDHDLRLDSGRDDEQHRQRGLDDRCQDGLHDHDLRRPADRRLDDRDLEVVERIEVFGLDRRHDWSVDYKLGWQRRWDAGLGELHDGSGLGRPDRRRGRECLDGRRRRDPGERQRRRGDQERHRAHLRRRRRPPRKNRSGGGAVGGAAAAGARGQPDEGLRRGTWPPANVGQDHQQRHHDRGHRKQQRDARPGAPDRRRRARHLAVRRPAVQRAAERPARYDYLLPQGPLDGEHLPIIVYEHEDYEGTNWYISRGSDPLRPWTRTRWSSCSFNTVYYRTNYPSSTSSCPTPTRAANSNSGNDEIINFGGYGDTPGSDPNEQAVVALVQYFEQKNCSVDPNKAYATGDSLGRISGSWALAIDYNH